MDNKKMTAEERLAAMKEKLIVEAFKAAHWMNGQAGKTPGFENHKDLPRNQVNSGVLIEVLAVLRMMGHETKDATWDDHGYSVCEYVEVDGEKIYTRETKKE